MHRNRLHRDDAAVSPVVGVVLLIAITIVLSATVFLLVGRLNGDRASPAPAFAVSKDPTARSLSVIRAGPDLDWFDDFQLGGDCTPSLNGGPFPSGPGTPVRAGDILTCGPGDDISVSSSQANGNSLLYQTSFG